MLREIGYCSGIENYSPRVRGREPGSTPYTLLDYFPNDFITFIDESHVTVPQVRGMSGGDRARKKNLIDYGFRLPSAYDNRPLFFEEFEKKLRSDRRGIRDPRGIREKPLRSDRRADNPPDRDFSIR